MKIVPVPTDRSLVIHLPQGFGLLNYTIFDIGGRIIVRGNEERIDGEFRLELDLKEGLYIIECDHNGSVIRGKFIIA